MSRDPLSEEAMHERLLDTLILAATSKLGKQHAYQLLACACIAKDLEEKKKQGRALQDHEGVAQ